MKKIISVLALSTVLAVGWVPAASAAEQKIAVVDIASVFQQLPQREKIVKQLKEEFELRIQELQNLEKEIRATVDKQKRDGARITSYNVCYTKLLRCVAAPPCYPSTVNTMLSISRCPTRSRRLWGVAIWQAPAYGISC